MKIINTPRYLVGKGVYEKEFLDKDEAVAYEKKVKDLEILQWFFGEVYSDAIITLESNGSYSITTHYTIQGDWCGHHADKEGYSTTNLSTYILDHEEDIKNILNKISNIQLIGYVDCNQFKQIDVRVRDFKEQSKKVYKTIETLLLNFEL